MKFAQNLAIKNLKRKPLRTFALIVFVAFMSLSSFSGSILVSGLNNGLENYKAMLGVDILVVPYEARTKGTFDSILLQGITGSYYMDKTYYEQIKATEGVEVASPQFFLASTSAGCCSVAVQIVGFDPETDFTIQPWIAQRYSEKIADGDIVVGADINVPVSKTLTFYNTECKVVASLEKTGTGLDTAVYANMNTVKQMAENSKALGLKSYKTSISNAVSSVMVKVKDGYDIDAVLDDINIHVRKVVAGRAQSSVSSVAMGLNNVSAIINVLVVAVWILSAVILIVAFIMIANERKKEFAVLRALGADGGVILKIISVESVIISVIGAIVGVLVSLLVILPFGDAIKSALSLPYLLPPFTKVALIGGLSVIISVLAGYITSIISVKRLKKSETGVILREDC